MDISTSPVSLFYPIIHSVFDVEADRAQPHT